MPTLGVVNSNPSPAYNRRIGMLRAAAMLSANRSSMSTGVATRGSVGGSPPAGSTSPTRQADDYALDMSSSSTDSASVSEDNAGSQVDLERDFAAAVYFVESYQGPHRILTQENSTPKKEFYALYQQATVGPCPVASPPPGLSKLEVAKWEKWRGLGQLSRHEAMQRYTTMLDNLVDDWRRSASVKPPGAYTNSSSSMASVAGEMDGVQAFRKTSSVVERLPKIYDEFGELQERLEEEVKKRDELETHLLSFTRENRALFSREMRQVDQMRTQLTSLVKTLEEDVSHHYNELQHVIQRQQELTARLESSIVFAMELRAQQVVHVVREWCKNALFRRVLFCLFLFRVWSFVRRRGLPRFIAQVLIKWITVLSDAREKPRLQLTGN